LGKGHLCGIIEKSFRRRKTQATTAVVNGRKKSSQ